MPADDVSGAGGASSGAAGPRVDAVAGVAPSRRRWLLVVVVAVQVVVLYDPGVPGSGGLADVFGLDKVVHVGVFAVVMAVARWSHVRTAVVLMLTVVQAPVSEIVQATLLPHRSGDWRDVVADLCGCALGWWFTRRRG